MLKYLSSRILKPHPTWRFFLQVWRKNLQVSGPPMQLTKPQPKVFEKNIHDRSGRLLRVRFVVAEFDGRVYGKILSVEPIVELRSRNCNKEVGIRNYELRFRNQSKQRPFLPLELVSSSIRNSKFILHNSLSSPYFHSLEFFTSQMTRAPSGAASGY